MKMLLSAGTTMSTSSNSALPASPSGEYSDEHSNRLGAYLHRIGGSSDRENHAVFKDHCYAKAWNWKPDNIYVKPVKKLFFTRAPVAVSDRLSAEADVDVEKVEPEDRSAPFDLSRIRHHMDEFQRLANFVRPNDDGDDDWEEKINKILWLPLHHRIFARVMRVLSAERLARLAKSNSWSEPLFRRTSGDTAAKRFRATLASTGWDWKTVQWLHNLLFDHLPRDYLAIYLDILQTLRMKIPQLIDRMIAVQPNISAKLGAVSTETLGSLLKRPWDPCAASLNSNRPKKLPGNPILIVAPSSVGTNVSSRQHKWISQLGLLGMVVNVHTNVALATSRMTMIACMEQLVQATRSKIQDVRVDCPGRPIILVGFNGGAALACQIAQMEHVTAVVCFGFPFTTVEGKRGTPDDTLMDIRCPVMFVIGENATLVRPDDLENVREKMLVETSLAIVGTADDSLRISTTKKLTEGITQSMVDRCVIEEIGDFVAGILLQPHPLPPRSFPVSSLNFGTKEKTSKKESRKRKISTSSSVDSEANVSPNAKKTRPVTPVTGTSVSNAVSGAARVAGLVGHTGIGCNVNSGISNNHPTPNATKKRSRTSNSNRKNNNSERPVANKNISQQHGTSTSNGGITLNIGSLASLAPIGPIRLAPTMTNHPAIANAKPVAESRSPVTLGPKMPKIAQPNVGQPTRMKTVVSSCTPGNWTKRFSKISGMGNSGNVVSPDKATEMKAFNILNTPTNQIALGASALASQNKSATNSMTSGALGALLQGGKHAIGTSTTMTSAVSAGRGVPASSSGVLPTPCMSNNTTVASSTSGGGGGGGGAAVTITATASAKVMDSIASVVGTGDSIKIGNSTISCCQKKNSFQDTSSTDFEIVKTTENDKTDDSTTTKSPMLLPFVNKSLTTILPISSRSKTTNRYGNAVPKITMNANNFQKSQRGKFPIAQSFRKKPFSMEMDEDLGNILDIPIIFAKDGENLNAIGREQLPLGQIYSSNSRIVDPIDAKPKRSATKVVLISNKQQPDKHRFVNNQISSTNSGSAISIDSGSRNVAQAILQSRSENQPVSLTTNWNVGSGLLPINSANRTNQPTIKYTKIILAKRNSGTSVATNNCEKSQQIVFTKTATKLSAGKIQSANNDRQSVGGINVEPSTSDARQENNSEIAVEIEDAIKTNIIERKLPMSIQEIDLTSPTKNQQRNETSIVTVAGATAGSDRQILHETESDT